jgi:eukaryotic-like serine/threonine-protein kinase
MTVDLVITLAQPRDQAAGDVAGVGALAAGANVLSTGDATIVELRTDNPMLVNRASLAASSKTSSRAPSDDTLLRNLPTLAHVGRYALKHQLGRGGLGTVYAAIDPLLSRPIALKMLHVDARVKARTGETTVLEHDRMGRTTAGSVTIDARRRQSDQRETFESMLLAEARAAAGLNHPNIVTVFDAGRDEQGVYIAMERLQGEDLKHKLSNGWDPKPQEAAQLVAKLADALDYAHRMGVVHCDIKPANVFLTQQGEVKLLDFGIAKVATVAIAEAESHSQQAWGSDSLEAMSPHYAAPEQINGSGADVRSDVYALGVVLYELLTGRKPFAGSTLEALRDDVLLGQPLLAHEAAPKVPRALSRIAARAMARNPRQRYTSAHRMARALHRVAGNHAAAGPSHLGTTAIAIGSAMAGVVMLVGAWVLHDQSRQHDDASTRWARRPTMVASDAPGASDDGAARPAALATVASGAKDVVAAASQVSASTTASGVARGAQNAGDAAPSMGSARKVDRSQAATPSDRTLRAIVNAPARVASAAQSRLTRSSTRTGTKAGTLGMPSTTVQLAIAPWGSVEVNGQSAGVTPPITTLSLPAGTHRVVVRNADFEPFVTTLVVDGRQGGAVIRHRFGL